MNIVIYTSSFKSFDFEGFLLVIIGNQNYLKRDLIYEIIFLFLGKFQVKVSNEYHA